MTDESKVIVYSKPNCSFCEKAKRLLIDHGVTYQEIDLSLPENADSLNMIRRLGCKSVPQIFINDEHIGGYDELFAKQITYLR